MDLKMVLSKLTLRESGVEEWELEKKTSMIISMVVFGSPKRW